MAKYRSYYTKPKKQNPSFLNSNSLSLNSELQNLQKELRELQTDIIRPQQRRQSNFLEADQFFTNKFILIGGCIAIGLGIGYLLFSRRRCK